MYLETEQLLKLQNKILEEIKSQIFIHNRMNDLDIYLDTIGCYALLEQENEDEEIFINQDFKIAILGDSKLTRNGVEEISSEYNIDSRRLELCLDYNELKKYNFNKLRDNFTYGAIIVGPMPHKTYGTDKYPSAIEMMENTNGYPQVYRVGTGSPISGNGLKKTFEQILFDKGLFMRKQEV